MKLDITAFCTPMIAIAVYILVEVIKSACGHNPKMKGFYPAIAATLGVTLGIVGYVTGDFETSATSWVSAAFIGLCSGLCATGTDQFMDGIRRKGTKAETTQETEDERGEE